MIIQTLNDSSLADSGSLVTWDKTFTPEVFEDLSASDIVILR